MPNAIRVRLQPFRERRRRIAAPQNDVLDVLLTETHPPRAPTFQPGLLGFDDAPTGAQLGAVPRLVKTLRREFPTIKKLAGHRDIKTDSRCPGDALYKHVPAFRAATSLAGP